MSLYGEFIKERSGKEIVESEKGFATYFYLDDGCYIENVYVKPEFRREGIASQFGDQISRIAKENGHNRIYGTVVPSENGSTESLIFLLEYGFKLANTSNNLIVLSKDI